MKITDPIADLLTRIRNAAAARKTVVTVPHSNLKESITKVLKDNGYVSDVHVTGTGVEKTITIDLNEARMDITLKSISTPGQRMYVKSKDIRKVLNGLGLSIVSTSKGVMSGAEARRQKVGGELLCEIY